MSELPRGLQRRWRVSEYAPEGDGAGGTRNWRARLVGPAPRTHEYLVPASALAAAEARLDEADTVNLDHLHAAEQALREIAEKFDADAEYADRVAEDAASEGSRQWMEGRAQALRDAAVACRKALPEPAPGKCPTCGGKKDEPTLIPDFSLANYPQRLCDDSFHAEPAPGDTNG